MQIIEELRKPSPSRDTVLTIGVFDGVHLGHRHLIGVLKEEARKRGLLSGVLTFLQRPQAVLTQTQRPHLTSPEERIALLADQGVDLVVPLTFTKELAKLSAREFTILLREHLRMRGLVIGPDFALGRGREGNTPVLRALGEELGFTVESVSPLIIEGRVVSSTAIRQALAQGDVVEASRMLGQPFALKGQVVKGEAMGRQLGFPTANLAVDPLQALPADGVYATRAYANNQVINSVTDIGLRPTFGVHQRTVEAFLLDFSGDLYEKELRIELVGYLRPEKRFDSPAALQAQIQQDVEQTRALLK